MGGADLCFLRPSARHQFLHCETTVYRVAYLFTSHRWSRYQIILFGEWQRHMCKLATCVRSLHGSVLVWSRTCTSELTQDYKSNTLLLDYQATVIPLLVNWAVIKQQQNAVMLMLNNCNLLCKCVQKVCTPLFGLYACIQDSSKS